MIQAQPSIPFVRCPRCGATMRLSTIEPDLTAGHSERLFECQCGFVYHQTERSRTDSARAAEQPTHTSDKD